MKTTLATLTLVLSLGAQPAAKAQDQEKVIGCWTMASRSGESIQFNRDGSFVFNDWNAKTSQFETLYGKWKLEQAPKGGRRVTLYYDDRSKQSFTMQPRDKAGYILTKAGGFRFAKAQPANCTEQ